MNHNYRPLDALQTVAVFLDRMGPLDLVFAGFTAQLGYQFVELGPTRGVGPSQLTEALRN